MATPRRLQARLTGLLRTLIKAGLLKRVGTWKSGQYILDWPIYGCYSCQKVDGSQGGKRGYANMTHWETT